MSAIENTVSEQDVTEIEIAEQIRDADANGRTLEITGGGTRKGLGRPLFADDILSTTRHSGITLYEPGALTIVVRAGTPVKQVTDTLYNEGQQLSFEPMDHRPLYAIEGEPTIGAVAACNISGPRRIQAGACRDSLLGVRFVDGQGNIIKNGGRVMKNVTGLDLVKLLCGSHGTLGVITQLAFKILPAAERAATLAIDGLSVKDAITALSRALGSPFEVTGAAHLPQNTLSSAQTVLRVEGFEKQVDYRLDALRKSVAGRHDTNIIEGRKHIALWQRIRDVEPFAGSDKPVWRLSVKPGDAPAIAKDIARETDAQFVFDWGGGLIWVQVDDRKTARGTKIRAIIARYGGHAMLVRALDSVRSSIPVFHPQSGHAASLSKSIREKFNPRDLLNPGRMA